MAEKVVQTDVVAFSQFHTMFFETHPAVESLLLNKERPTVICRISAAPSSAYTIASALDCSLLANNVLRASMKLMRTAINIEAFDAYVSLSN